MNEFTLDMLERLEEIVCPRCGGSGEREIAHIFSSDPRRARGAWGCCMSADGKRIVHLPGEHPDATSEPCDVCLGQRHVWRLAAREDA